MKLGKKALIFVLIFSALIPATTFAAVQSIQHLFQILATSAVWIVFTAIVLFCFISSGILFLTSGGVPDNLKRAKASFLWGVVGVVVGIVAYSIIEILSNILG